MVHLKINGKGYAVEEGKRILAVLNENGIRVPHLCFHHALTPAAACRLCVVEARDGDSPPTIKLSCAIKARAGMEIITESAMIHQQRNIAMGNLLAMAPQSDALLKLGDEFGLTMGRIPDGCIRCRLCMRVCKEVIGAAALTMVKKNGEKYVVPSKSGNCIGCGTCANICPTDAIRVVDKDNVRTMMVGEQVIAAHPLLRCDMCQKLFATPKFMEHMEKQEKEAGHPDTKDTHHYCPTCSKLYSLKNRQLTASVFAKPHGFDDK